MKYLKNIDFYICFISLILTYSKLTVADNDIALHLNLAIKKKIGITAE